MADPVTKPSPVDAILGIVRRRKWLAAIAFAVPFTALVSAAAVLPDVYRSTAMVLVDRQQVPEAFVKSTVTSGLETRLQTITQEILSRTRLEELIARFGLYPDLKKRLSPDALIERARHDIQLEIKGAGPSAHGTAMIAFAISYRGSNPRTVAQVANTLASSYIEENLKVRERQATGTAQFLKAQLDETKKRLDEQERQVSEFKSRHMGELPQQLEANLGTLERLHTQLRLNTENQIKTLERRDALAKQSADPDAGLPSSPGAPPPPAPDANVARLAKLKQELTALRTQFAEKYPDVVHLKAEIAELERTMHAPDDVKADGTPAAPGAPPARPMSRAQRLIADIDADLKGLKAEEREVRTAIAAYQKRVENAPRHEQAFQELSRDYQSTKELYRALVNKYDEAQIAESMEQRQKGEQFRVLDPALPSDEPAAPKRGRLILMGFFVSLGLAAGVAVLAEKLDTSFHTVEDLRLFTRIPVLVRIPRVVTPADRAKASRRMQIGAAVAAVGLVVLATVTCFAARGNEQLVAILSKGSS